MRIRLLGEVAVRDDRGWVRAGPAHRSAVLASLAMSPGRVVPRGLLVRQVWGDPPPAGVHDSLYGHVARLRRLLKDVPGTGIVRGGRDGYLLTAPADTVDLFRWRAVTEDARRRRDGGDHAAALELWRQAVDGWGESVPLAGIDTEWARGVRTALRREHRDMLFGLFEAALETGAHESVRDRLTAACRAHPHDEPFHGQLMRAHHAAGRRAEALAVFDALTVRLRDDLGLEPGAAVREQHDRIRRGAPARAAEPERARPRQLPAPPAGIVGRGPARDRLDALLAESAQPVPILLITGMAGVGKTSVALQWAHHVADRFPDGQLYCEMRGFDDRPPRTGHDVLASLLSSLGVSGRDVPADTAARAGLWRSLTADRRILLTLDSVADPEPVRELLPAGPGSCVLVTSRHRMPGLTAWQGAGALSLEVLDDESARRLLADVVGPRRCEAEPEAVDQLVTLCGGLPLALRIAAANLADRPSDTIAEYVADLTGPERLRSLAVPGDPGAAVRYAFDRSYRALPEPVKSVFHCLGVSPGPTVPATAAAAMTGLSPVEVESALRTLTAAHLVEPAGTGRVRLHDLLGQYARELCTATELAATSARLHDWYAHAARAASEAVSTDTIEIQASPGDTAPFLPVFGDDAEAAAWYTAEYPNLAAVVREAAASGLPAAWLIPEALRIHQARSMNVTDWREFAELGLAAASRAGVPDAVAGMSYLLSLHAKIMGDSGTAADLLGKALSAATEAGNLRQVATVHASLADMHHRNGDLPAAAESARRALTVVTPPSERQAMIAGNVLGVVHLEQGDPRQAVAVLERNLRLLENSPNKRVPTWFGLALARLWCGDLSGAWTAASRSLAAATVPDDAGQARTGLARVHVERGEQAQAWRTAREAHAVMTERKGTVREPVALVALAWSAPDHATAEPIAERCIRVATELSMPYEVIEARLVLAKSRLTVDAAAAADAAVHAAEDADARGFRLLSASARLAEAAARYRLGEADTARELVSGAVEEFRLRGALTELARGLSLSAELSPERRAELAGESDGLLAATGAVLRPGPAPAAR
ncbi:AfsR/SARP family transcriptional regulator [Stackebrandtia albiflava]|uniref:AfsR/SARP family transcriptional regulator n=1 Tax=Stackebrandtia albiflava TaxID=406432 RepID=UPI0011BD7B72|nr:BTAD domain-containing putative transcriptional regulator [Stackebrandtia albiflava]